MIFLTFILGLIANFIGYIPPGNINLTLVQIAVNRGQKQALQFITAFSIVEFFFTLFIMHAAKWLAQQAQLDTAIDFVMIALFGTLAVITWMHRNKPPKTKYSNYASIRYGIMLGFLNPMQIPFWMITGTYLITHEWILDGWFALVIFSIGSAAGSFLCLYAYAKFAQYIQNRYALSNRVINTCIALLFSAFALYHIFKQVYITWFK